MTLFWCKKRLQCGAFGTYSVWSKSYKTYGNAYSWQNSSKIHKNVIPPEMATAGEQQTNLISSMRTKWCVHWRHWYMNSRVLRLFRTILLKEERTFVVPPYLKKKKESIQKCFRTSFRTPIQLTKAAIFSLVNI